MPRIDEGRLFIDTGDVAQLVFSRRVKSEDEQDVSIKTLVRTVLGRKVVIRCSVIYRHRLRYTATQNLLRRTIVRCRLNR